MARIITFSTILIFTAGCTQYWYSKDKTYNKCRTDCMECRITTSRFYNEDGSLSRQAIKLEEKCMREKGYRLVSEKSLPMECEKRQPDPIYKEKYGISGPSIVDITD